MRSRVVCIFGHLAVCAAHKKPLLLLCEHVRLILFELIEELLAADKRAVLILEALTLELLQNGFLYAVVREFVSA